MTLVLIGNKCDREDAREVEFEEGQKLAEDNNMLFFEASAKTSVNVDKIFNESAEEIFNKI